MLGITSNLLCVVTVLQLICLTLLMCLSSNDINNVHVHDDTSYVKLVYLYESMVSVLTVCSLSQV